MSLARHQEMDFSQSSSGPVVALVRFLSGSARSEMRYRSTLAGSSAPRFASTHRLPLLRAVSLPKGTGVDPTAATPAYHTMTASTYRATNRYVLSVTTARQLLAPVPLVGRCSPPRWASAWQPMIPLAVPSSPCGAMTVLFLSTAVRPLARDIVFALKWVRLPAARRSLSVLLIMVILLAVLAAGCSECAGRHSRGALARCSVHHSHCKC